MTDTDKQKWWRDALKSVGPLINTGIYWLLAVSYNILLLIANSELFTGETVIQIFNRVQLVIGVFMVFRLTMLVLQGIINPDTFTDSKSGASNIIVKIITSLALLTLLIPINIPKAASEMNSFEKRINNNGLLFGILYDFQYRVLSQNLLGNLILGTGATDSEDNVLNSGDSMASTVLKSFFTPNLKKSNYKYNSNGHYDYDDLFCEDFDYEKFYNTKNPSAILGMATDSCDLKEYNGMGGYEGYAYSFNWFISLIVAIIFVVVLLGMAVEVAKRAIKIAILRLIAPIPIISYMNPKASMDNGSLGSWVKSLSSTYIELFINVTIIYFAIFMINQISNGQLQFINSTGQKIGGFTIMMAKIFIFIGILLFAKEAPKFIKQALGMKDEGGKGYFSGIAAAAGLGALGAKKLAGGTISAATGNGFRAGANQFHGDGFLSKVGDTYKKLTPIQQERKKNRLDGEQELKQMHKNWQHGDKVYGKIGSNAFTGDVNDRSYEDAFKNREFIQSKRALDAADNAFKDASKRYNEAYSNGNLTQELVEEYQKAEKTLQGKQKVHDSMRKKYYKDAEIEDAYKFRKYNSTDPTRVDFPYGNSSSSTGSYSTQSVPTQSAGTGSSNNSDDIRERIDRAYNVHDPVSYDEHQKTQGEYNDLFNSDAGARYVDANEKMADEKHNNGN